MSYIKSRIKLYSGQNCASGKFKYANNDSSATRLLETTATAGMKNVSGYEKLTLGYRCATKAATYIQLRVEGRFEQNDAWGFVSTLGINATQTMNSLYTIPHQIKYFRVGASTMNVKSRKPNSLYVDLLTCE